MNEKNTDILDLKLTGEGATYLLKTFTLTRWLFIYAIIGTFLSLALIIIKFIFLRTLDSDEGWMFYMEKHVFPFLGLLQLACFFVQLYLYFQFVQKCRQSIILNDMDVFNQSFRSFYKSTRFAFVQLFISLVITAFYIYFYLELMGKRG